MVEAPGGSESLSEVVAADDACEATQSDACNVALLQTHSAQGLPPKAPVHPKVVLASHQHAATSPGASQMQAGSFPLSYFIDKGFQGIGIGLGLPGASSAPVQMAFDLGSASLAFCDGVGQTNKLAGGSGVKTNLGQCQVYGASPDGCYTTFMYGSVYHGDVQIYGGDNGTEVAGTLGDVYYTIMDNASDNMICSKGFDGIIGSGFRGIQQGTVLKDNGDASSLLKSCSSGSVLCDTNPGGLLLPTAWEQGIKSMGAGKFGIHLDYSRTKGLPIGMHLGLGTLYTGEAAVENDMFKNSPNKTTIKMAPFEFSGTYQHWNFEVKGWTISTSPGQPAVTNMTLAPENMCALQTCIFDSGNPAIQMPEAAVLEANKVWYDGHHGATINFMIYENSTSSDKLVTISIPLAFVIELQKPNNAGIPFFTMVGPALVFGLPIFGLFNMAFDMNAHTLTLAPIPEAVAEVIANNWDHSD